MKTEKQESNEIIDTIIALKKQINKRQREINATMERLNDLIVNLYDVDDDDFDDASGTICKKCHCDKTSVIDSRKKDGMQIRRRECYCCGYKWFTKEVIL